MQLLAILSIVFFCIGSVTAGPLEYLAQRRALQQSAASLFPPIPFKEFNSAVSTSFIYQKLDHNDKSETRTFKQRYYWSSAYAKNENSPILLFICGEGECGEYSLAGQMAKNALKIKAHMLSLEHRYYGKSQPFSDLNTENLKYLSVDQALKDIIAFIDYARKQHGLRGAVVTIGGSYPGSLSAYMRAMYPNTIAGALASSAPVRAENNFIEYDRHLAEQVDEQCGELTRQIVREIEAEMGEDAGFETVKNQFGASELARRDDFLYLLADTVAISVQYGAKEQFCDKIRYSGRTGYIEALKEVEKNWGSLVNYSAQAAEDASIESHNSGIGMRQWFYQSCTEYGYWQNAYPDRKLSMRSEVINMEYHKEVCRRLFGINELANTDITNKKFYEPLLNKNTGNLLLTNGSEDPWIKLSISDLKENLPNPNLDTAVMDGAAHCDDLRSNPTNNNVIEVQNRTFELISNWLNL